MSIIVAIPSSNPGGMDAQVSAHFGHCDCYTLVTIEDSKIQDAKVVPSVPHKQGGCLAPVQFLADKGVKVLISGGMGLRPLMGFNDVGIDVYHGGAIPGIREVVDAFAAGKLPQFTRNLTCGGGGSHDHQCQGDH